MKSLKKNQDTHKEQQLCEDCGKTFLYKSDHIAQFHTKRTGSGGNCHQKMILQGF